MRTIVDIIKDKTIEVGDCMEWTGYLHPIYGHPQTSSSGKPITVRRLLAIRLGMSPGKRIVTNSCGNRMCVAPHHLVMTTRKAKSAQIFRLANMSPKLKMKRHALTRKKSKLTYADAVAIRNIEGKTQGEIAQMYGVSQRAVWNILQFKSWREDIDSPMGRMLMSLAA